MWEWAWESACPKEWGCRKKAQDLAQSYKINGSTNGFENKDFASFKVKFYNCEKRIGRFDSGVEKSAAQNVASQGPVHDCSSICKTEKVLAKLTCPKIKISISFDPMKKPSWGFVPFIERSISTRGNKKLIFFDSAISVVQKLLRLSELHHSKRSNVYFHCY